MKRPERPEVLQNKDVGWAGYSMDLEFYADWLEERNQKAITAANCLLNEFDKVEEQLTELYVHLYKTRTGVD